MKIEQRPDGLYQLVRSPEEERRAARLDADAIYRLFSKPKPIAPRRTKRVVRFAGSRSVPGTLRNNRIVVSKSG